MAAQVDPAHASGVVELRVGTFHQLAALPQQPLAAVAANPAAIGIDGVPRRGQEVWSGPTADPPEKLYTGDRAWDREATHTDDVESFLPLASLKAHAEAGRIAGLAQRFHGVPTDYSQRNTLEKDAPEILERCREDSADIALLVPL